MATLVPSTSGPALIAAAPRTMLTSSPVPGQLAASDSSRQQSVDTLSDVAPAGHREKGWVDILIPAQRCRGVHGWHAIDGATVGLDLGSRRVGVHEVCFEAKVLWQGRDIQVEIRLLSNPSDTAARHLPTGSEGVGIGAGDGHERSVGIQEIYADTELPAAELPDLEGHGTNEAALAARIGRIGRIANPTHTVEVTATLYAAAGARRRGQGRRARRERWL